VYPAGNSTLVFFNDLHTKFIWGFIFYYYFLGVQVVATAIAAILIDRLGRRVLLLSSALVMIFSLYGLGLYFWMLEHNPAEAGHLGFLPLSCLCLFIAAFSLGFGPIPWLMMSELFSPEVKGVTSSISGNYNDKDYSLMNMRQLHILFN
jgi:MFS family permease